MIYVTNIESGSIEEVEMVDYNRKTILAVAECVEGYTLKEVLESVNDLIKRYGENAEVDYTTKSTWDDNQYLYVFSVRPETDDEMKNRIKSEEYRQKMREVLEKKEYERLKKKFES